MGRVHPPVVKEELSHLLPGDTSDVTDEEVRRAVKNPENSKPSGMDNAINGKLEAGGDCHVGWMCLHPSLEPGCRSRELRNGAVVCIVGLVVKASAKGRSGVQIPLFSVSSHTSS